MDPHRHPALPHASREELLDKHLAAQAKAGELLRTCDVLVLTFGLLEAWFDRALGVFTNETPPAPMR